MYTTPNLILMLVGQDVVVGGLTYANAKEAGTPREAMFRNERSAENISRLKIYD